MNALLLGLAIVTAAPSVKEPPKKDPPTLLGEWAAESGVRGGKADNPPPGTTITFHKEGKVSFKEGGGGAGEDGTYTSDPKKSPAEIDIMSPGAGKGVAMLGIYKIEGDTLTMCITMGGDRPKAFESPAGSEAILITCKRAKKE